MDLKGFALIGDLDKDSVGKHCDVVPNAEENSRCHFIAGVAGGIAEWLIGHPLDTVRVRIMAGSATGVVPGAFSQLSTALRSVSGVVSLYRGSTSDLLSCAVGSSLLYGVNHVFKTILGVSTDDGLSPRLVLAAALTGVVDATFYKPLEIIKLRMQIESNHSSFTESVRSLWTEGGVRSIYRGIYPAVIREALGSAAYFAAYEICKVQLCHLYKIEPKEASGNIILFSGGIAGMSYVLSIHPLETVAVLQQLDDLDKPKYKSILDCATQVIRQRGVLGLYKGMAPTLARAFPCYAAAFYGYEGALKIIRNSSWASSTGSVKKEWEKM